MRRRILICLVLVAGCAPQSAPEPPAVTTTTRTTVAPRQTIDLTRQHGIEAIDFMAPRAEVWSAMLESYGALGIPASAIDEQAGTATFLLRDLVRSIAGKPASTLVDCGMGAAGPRANSYRITIRLTSLVESVSPTHTRVHTINEAWARSPGISSDRVDCSSTGALERQITGMISTRVVR